jgi:hypothetical protein
VIPDLHNHTENADHWLTTQRHDRVIYLGDFFDDFGDNVNDARRTAMWMRDRMDSTDDIFLLGNHDAAYMFPDIDELHCPGFTRAKARAINEILKPKHWHRFKLAHEEQGWVLSHAGFHPTWLEGPTVKGILSLCDKAMKKAQRRIIDPLLGAGSDRGGMQCFGGPLWMDWDSLLPVSGINQIVGHTPGERVRERPGFNCLNYCIDVGNGAAALVIENSKITLF